LSSLDVLTEIIFVNDKNHQILSLKPATLTKYSQNS